ncbi:MAG: RNA polymerase sigma factor [Candidatus Poribacteria bacterium]|nr:MAG: RNA polymerase sigma factor [Candidatus Poribacteria bacterium]
MQEAALPIEGELDALLSQLRPGILALCYRLVGSLEDAEDLTQEVLLKIAQGIDRFEGRSSVRTWAYRIATNTCYNFLKSARKRRERVVPHPLETSDEFLELIDPERDREAVRETLEFSFICVLQELSPLQRLVVVLRDVLGWSVRETAAALHSAPAPIKNIHSRARKRLQKLRHRSGNLSPDDPEAQAFMHRFAQAHLARDLGRCLQFYDQESVVHAFPVRKYTGRKEIREFYQQMVDQMPTLFIAVKVNGTLGAACYQPRQGRVSTHRRDNRRDPPPCVRKRPLATRCPSLLGAPAGAL